MEPISLIFLNVNIMNMHKGETTFFLNKSKLFCGFSSRKYDKGIMNNKNQINAKVKDLKYGALF